MKTEDLIRVMAADGARPRPVETILPLALAATAAAAALLLVATLGVRPDLAEALRRPPAALKQAFALAILLTALGGCLRLSHPEGRLGGWSGALLVGPAIVVASFWGAALTTPVAGWPATVAGDSMGACLAFITVSGAAILAGSLWALRRGASTRPRLTGALAGMASGSAAATVYAVHCTDDSPMFWGVWYVIAIGLVTALGALAGRRALAW